MPYGGPPQPRYVPDVPLAVRTFDPVARGYRAGKIDTDTERFSSADRYPVTRPVVIDEPRAIASSGHLEYRLPEPRYIDEGYMAEARQREAEDYVYRRPSEPGVVYNPNPSSRTYIPRCDLTTRDEYDPLRWREAEENIDRRLREPSRIGSTNLNPFARTVLPRGYSVTNSSSVSGW
jgi:hypothetical protein